MDFEYWLVLYVVYYDRMRWWKARMVSKQSECVEDEIYAICVCSCCSVQWQVIKWIEFTAGFYPGIGPKCVSHAAADCRFDTTDPAADEAIIPRITTVVSVVFISDAAPLLSYESKLRAVEECLGIASGSEKACDLLKRTSDTYHIYWWSPGHPPFCQVRICYLFVLFGVEEWVSDFAKRVSDCSEFISTYSMRYLKQIRRIWEIQIFTYLHI